MTAAQGHSGRSNRWERAIALCLYTGSAGGEPSGLMDQQKRREMTHRLWSTGKDFDGGSTEQLSARAANSVIAQQPARGSILIYLRGI